MYIKGFILAISITILKRSFQWEKSSKNYLETQYFAINNSWGFARIINVIYIYYYSITVLQYTYSIITLFWSEQLLHV